MSEEQERQPWDRLPDEPTLWFARFDEFRLMGTRRSVNAVCSQAAVKAGKKPRGANKHWSDAAARWRWRERASAWDEYIIKENAKQTESALQALQSAGIEAANRLIQILKSDNDREARQAAAEILDRIGVSRIAKTNFGGSVSVTDERESLMAAIEREVARSRPAATQECTEEPEQ